MVAIAKKDHSATSHLLEKGAKINATDKVAVGDIYLMIQAICFTFPVLDVDGENGTDVGSWMQ